MSLHFLRPYWFLMIIPFAFVCWRLSRQHLTDNWQKICDRHLLPALLIEPKHRFIWPLIMLLLSGIIAITAMAGPSWHQESQTIYRTTQGTVIVLNLSPSMSDKMGTTTKIDRARFKLLDFLAKQKEGLTGVVVYTDEAHVISPLTEDNNTIANFVPSLDPAIMSTFNDDSEQGLKAAERLFTQAGISTGNVILITDKITNENSTEEAAAALANAGYPLTVFALGADATQTKVLKKIAEIGKGQYVPLTANNDDIEQLVAQTKIKHSSPLKRTDEKGTFWHDDGRWLVFLLLPFALLAFRRGYL